MRVVDIIIVRKLFISFLSHTVRTYTTRYDAESYWNHQTKVDKNLFINKKDANNKANTCAILCYVSN